LESTNGSASDGPRASYRPAEASAGLQIYHREHGGGEDRGAGRGKATLGQARYSAGTTGRRQADSIEQGRDAQHDQARRERGVRIQGQRNHRRGHRHYIAKG